MTGGEVGLRALGRKARAVIYARISLDRTGAGLGVERQREDCERLVQERGWTLVDTLTDNDVSAYSGKVRHGYRTLLESMRSGAVDVVVAWHTDRLHRNPSELEEYIRISEESHTTTVTARAGELDLSTAAGRMVARMLGAAARHESEQKSERVRRRRRQDAEAGRAHGPLGYGYDDRKEIVPAQAKVVREIAERLLRGDTLYSIASDLNERCVPTPGAGRWTHRQVSNLLLPGIVADQTGSVAVLKSLPEPCKAMVRAAASDEPLGDVRISKLLNACGIAGTGGGPWTARSVESLPDGMHGSELVMLLRSGQLGPHGRVARALNSAGVEATRTMWRAANLRGMIRRGTLCGWRDFGPGGRGGGGDMVAEGDWEPILTREESLKIRAILDAPERKRTGRERRSLLASILVCGRCGAPLSGYSSPRDGRRYACSSQPGLDRCGRLTIVAEPVEAAVVGAVFAALSDVTLRQRQLRGTQDGKVTAAELELDEIRTRRDEYARDAADGRITRAEWMIVRDGLADRQRRVEQLIGSVRRPESAILRSVPTSREQLEKWWETAPLRKQREVLRVLIEKVVVNPASRGGNKFDLGRLSAPLWRF